MRLRSQVRWAGLACADVRSFKLLAAAFPFPKRRWAVAKAFGARQGVQDRLCASVSEDLELVGRAAPHCGWENVFYSIPPVLRTTTFKHGPQQSWEAYMECRGCVTERTIRRA